MLRRLTISGLVAVLGAVVGFLAGATLGGNFAPDFEFAGVRGYEATGQLGALAGAIAGLGAGFALGGRGAQRME